MGQARVGDFAQGSDVETRPILPDKLAPQGARITKKPEGPITEPPAQPPILFTRKPDRRQS